MSSRASGCGGGRPEFSAFEAPHSEGGATFTRTGRAAFDKFLPELPPARKLRIAMRLYEKGEATVRRVEEIADIPLREARHALRDEGILREGSETSAEEMPAKAKAGAAKYRK